MLVCESLKKNIAIQAKKKEKLSAKDKGKVVDLEAKEGMEDIDTKQVDLKFSWKLIKLAII